jgi:diguanylate cyclase (GGDEF)-like protein
MGSVAPSLNVMMDYRSYGSRIVVLVFILLTAYYVHRVYVRRLRSNAAQVRTQALLSGIVSSFSLADRENAAGMMRGLLTDLTDYFGAQAELVSIAENEFCDLLGVWSYCADGSEVPPDRHSQRVMRWKEYRLESPSEPNASPYEHRDAPDQTDRIKRMRWVFIPVYKRETPVAFFYIENTLGDAEWTRDQLVTLPVISRIVSDALEKLSSERRIKFMAYYDALTRLPNRQLFQDRAEQAIHQARRNNKLLAILFLDLDFFKSINDTMGHEGGDLLIQAIGKRLNDILRRTDTIARFGGDEFLILLNDLTYHKDIILVADKVMDVFKKPILLKGQEVFITASAGISVFPADGDDAQSLVKHADIAMYMAKDKGKNQYAFCYGGMKEMVQYRVNLSNHLYRALERNELKVFYQPQIDLKTEKITGLEALLRWFHPEYGLISPIEFISIAEQTGLINSIGVWVLETACQQAAAWKRMGLGNLRIAVNLSVVQLRNPSLVHQVENVILSTGIEPELVELEITESTTTREPDYIIRVLNDLKRLGVSISIDDFGIEYSSLNRLKTLPVDRLKMDIQFVHGIDKSPKDQAIAMVIISLAQNLNLKLVAEGVENRTQLDFLKSRMCDEVQGYYFYKPMAAEEIEQILTRFRDEAMDEKAIFSDVMSSAGESLG